MATQLNRRWFAVASAPGTGDISVGAAQSGYATLGAANDGQTFDGVTFLDGTAWEVCNGCTYTHGTTTLTRGTREDSSTGSALTLSSSTTVMLSVSASKMTLLEQQLDRAYTYVRGNGTTTQTLTAGANTKIAAVLASVVNNPKSWWDTTNKQFLPTRAGNYLINASAQIATGNSTLQCSIFKNGASVGSGAYGTSASSQVAVVNTIVSFNGTTDYADLRVYTDGASIVVGGGGFTNNFFIATYLGA